MRDKIEELMLFDEELHYSDSFIETYLINYKEYLLEMNLHQQKKECISGYNRMKRSNQWSSDSHGVAVSVGDICYLDYGHMYINEAGYQHFGLVVASFNYKLLVIPMTSNPKAVKQAVNVLPSGKSHLFYIGQVMGLNKHSVLFLNDCKFINSSRVISINAKIEVDSVMFKRILNHLKDGIFGIEV